MPYKNKEDVDKKEWRYRRTPKGKYTRLKAKAKQRGIECTLTQEEYCELCKELCDYCGARLPEAGCGLDRKDNTNGIYSRQCSSLLFQM